MAIYLFYGAMVSPLPLVLSPLPSRERARVRGWRNEVTCMPPFALSVSKGLMERALMFATLALYGRAGPVTFGIRPKSNPKGLPLHPACSLRCSQRAGPAQIARWRANRALVGSWCGSTTARCSAPRRGLKVRFEPILDRFAIGATTPLLFTMRCQCPAYQSRAWQLW